MALGTASFDDIGSLLTDHSKLIADAIAKAIKDGFKKSNPYMTSFVDTYESLMLDAEDSIETHRSVTIADRRKQELIQRKWEDDLLSRSNNKQRTQIREHQILRMKRFKEEYEQKQKLERELQLKIELAETEDEKNKLKKRLESNQQFLAAYEDEYSNINANIVDTLKEKLKDATAAVKEGTLSSEDLKKDIGELEIQLNSAESDDDKKAILETMKQASKAFDAAQKKEAADEVEEEAKNKADQERKASLKKEAELKRMFTTLDGAIDGLNAGVNKVFNAIDKPISSFYEYQSKYNARLQGSENTYNKMMANLSAQIGLSPFIKQSKMVENLQKAIDTGINYNVELRSYIATVTESIASTFDAFDGELMRLIRIQQSDSTAARMGMEAALTKFFNSKYSDTNYLAGTSDEVTHALLDASAQLSHKAATEFEYIVQKWLGSLYSVGVSGQAVTNIATGLGYLGSGNTEDLFNNESLMTLLALSAERGGTSISDILNTNLDAEKTNRLLAGMVDLLRDIADNTDSSNVTKSALSNVFGISHTDLRSIANLSTSDITDIHKDTLTYNEALNEANSQVKQIWKRTHISAMLNTLIENATNATALTIGSNPALYGLYKATDLISQLVGDRGIEIPGIQAMGSGTASGISIIPIMKAGIVGMGLLGPILGSLANLPSGGLPSLNRWKGYEKSLSRGSNFIAGAGVQEGFSESTTYTATSSTNSDDLTKSAVDSSTSSANENQSEEDKQAKSKAEEYQDTVKLAMEQLLLALEMLNEEKGTRSISVRVKNDDANPLPVKIAMNNNDAAIVNTKLVEIDDEASARLIEKLVSNEYKVDIIDTDMNTLFTGFTS